MKKAFAFFTVTTMIFACSKQEIKEEIAICLTPPTELSGNWKVIEMRADPGDGSGKFIPTSQQFSISFNNGVYTDTRNTDFNRYRFIAQDTIDLYHSVTANKKQLALQQLTSSTLTYYCNWPWCGGPYGEKFIKQ